MSAVAEFTVLDAIAETVASTLKIPRGRLDVDAGLDSFGMDSIIAMELMTNLSRQLKVSITPAQLTSVSSIRELATVIEAAMRESEVASQPAARTVPAAQPVKNVVTAASRRPRAVAEAMRPAAEPRSDGASSLRQLLQFVKNEYGLDLSSERFDSKHALIDFLVEHHADALALYYGLSTADEDDVSPVAPGPAASARGLDVAIVGMACHFADAKSPSALWQNLVDGRCSIKALAGDRWRPRDDEGAPSRWGALIDGVEHFDAEFFGLSAQEAALIDPQERLVMQTLYHALQNAGIRADKLRGSRTALFLGYEYSEYEHYLRRNLHRVAGAPVFSSSSPIYYLANRISFVYDFKGPSEVVNASCASSALAIHRACQSLAQGECDLAICGGVSLNLFAEDYAAISHYGLLSPDGSCAVFDDNANGFTRGEGAGLLVLKRMDDAARDNNRVFAKVVATHQTNRGRAGFISEIKHEAITQVIRECYEKHAIPTRSVRYIEVDGYSTKWGDSFEFEGIRNALQADAAGGKNCALGSIKGNIGHVEPASGVASAIKLALALHYKQFPATITKQTLSSFIDAESPSHPLYIADRPLLLDELRHRDEEIRAGINSFSDSGVNVHVVLEECRSQREHPRGEERGPQLFVFSARTSESLRHYLEHYADYLQRTRPASTLEDLAYTLQLATEPMEHRVAIVASGKTELLQLLTRAGKLLEESKLSDGKGPLFMGQTPQRDSRRFLDVLETQIGADKLLENLRNKQFNEVALLWTSGMDMPWEAYWREIEQARRRRAEVLPQIIDIPLYPFARKRHWLDFDDAEAITPETPHEPAAPAATGQDEQPAVARDWRFVTELGEGDRPEVLDGAEKVRLFIIQETAALLRVGSGSVDDGKNFLELGFDSVAMMTLIQQLIQLLDASISPSVVFKHQDIASLSRHLASSHPDKLDRIHVVGNGQPGAEIRTETRAQSRNSALETWFTSREAVADGLIVPMQTNATGTPIFAVPGADGSVLSLQTLSRALEGVRPMFAFEAVGLDGKHEPLQSVREIAEANIAALKAMRDCHRVNLLGHSNGAVIAFEMARRLLKKNIAVERLVLLDCRCPAGAARKEADEIAGAFVDLIRTLGGEQQLDVAEFARIPEENRAEYLFELVRRNGFGISHEHFMLAYRLALANEKACRNYRPGKLDRACETIVVRGKQSNGEGPADLGWNRFLTTPARCIEIDADHLSILGKDAGLQIAQLFR